MMLTEQMLLKAITACVSCVETIQKATVIPLVFGTVILLYPWYMGLLYPWYLGLFCTVIPSVYGSVIPLVFGSVILLYPWYLGIPS